MWGEHMHHGYYVQGNKPKNMEDHRWVAVQWQLHLQLTHGSELG